MKYVRLVLLGILLIIILLLLIAIVRTLLMPKKTSELWMQMKRGTSACRKAF